ncbi:MAG: hypothetical protein LBI96_07440 [Odoribacteraceae bacterium]|jgi:hypothetical protein|nr:hypothetical protein [Odoribacteraceae bacterium]
MTYLLLVVVLLIAVAIILLLSRSPGREESSCTHSTGCCGAHATCEKLARHPPVSPTRPDYFDDEELDAFRGTPPDAYTPAGISAFRDILYTLRPGEIPDWMASLEHRGITLPDPLRQEATALNQAAVP